MTPVDELALRRARRLLEDYCRREAQGGRLLHCRATGACLSVHDARGQPLLRLCQERGGWRLYAAMPRGGWQPWPHLPEAARLSDIERELNQPPLHVHW